MMKKTLTLLLLAAAMHLGAADTHALNFKVIQKSPLTILAEGEVEADDTQRLKEVVAASSQAEEMDQVTISFNGSGGSYAEAVTLGRHIFDMGYSTHVARGNECEGPCALAFLGGRFLGASSGWGHSKKLAVGSRLIFSPVHAARRFSLRNSTGNRPSPSGTPSDAALAASVHSFLSLVQVHSPDIFSAMFDDTKAPLRIASPVLLKALHIDVEDTGGSFATTALNERQIVELARRAIASRGASYDCDEGTHAVREVSGLDLLSSLNKAVVDRFGGDGTYRIGKNASPLTSRVSDRTRRGVLELYFDLRKLDLVPDVGMPDHMYRVSGFSSVHAYLSKIPYVLTYDSGKASFRCVVLLVPEYEVGGGTVVYGPEKHGDVVYDVFPEDRALW